MSLAETMALASPKTGNPLDAPGGKAPLWGIGMGSGSGSGKKPSIPQPGGPRAPMWGTSKVPGKSMGAVPRTKPERTQEVPGNNGGGPSAPNYGESRKVRQQEQAAKAIPGEMVDLEESKLDDTPDWAIGHGEQPSGVRNMGGWTMKIFTPEQQNRLGVNEYGEHKVGALGLGENAKSTKPVAKKKTTSTVLPSDDPTSDVVSSDSAANDETVDTEDSADDVDMPSDDPWPWR